MKRAGGIILALVAGFGVSCSSLRPEQKAPREAVTIRYVNISVVYEMLQNRSEKAAALKKERTELNSRTRTAEEKLITGEGDRKKLLEELASLKETCARLEDRERAFKEETLKRISSAVSIVAKETGADFVLSMGDEVIFAQKKYDITEEVMREVMRQESRREPVVR